MEIIVGILAMFVAFAALWLGSVAMKKADDQFAELAKALRAELSKMRSETNESVNVATKRIATMEKRLDELQHLDTTTHEALSAIRSELVALKDELTATQTALPPQYRRRSKPSEPRANN